MVHSSRRTDNNAPFNFVNFEIFRKFLKEFIQALKYLTLYFNNLDYRMEPS